MNTPSFALDFTSAILDPSITFTRSGNTATRVNSSGLVEVINADLPRFDFNPVTLACRGLLIEEEKTNLFLHSSDFTNAVWNTNAAATANQGTSPSGNNDATLWTLPGTGSSTYQLIVVNSTSCTISVYAKKGDSSVFDLLIRNQTTATNLTRFRFNLDTLTFSLQAGNGTATLENAGNGWVRASVTQATSITSGNTIRGYVYPAGTTGAAGLFTYLWGAQLETGAFATSYIPTEASALTRNADVATITGTNFSDFWQAGKGGASVIATPLTVSGVRPLVQFDDTTANEIIALRGNAANPELQIVDGGAPQVQLDAGTIVANTSYSLTGWWQTNDCKARQNSGATVSDYTATIPTVTQMRIGSDGTNYLNGTIATIDYYDSFFGRPIYTRRKNKVFPSLL
jgi:hypothetical protein